MLSICCAVATMKFEEKDQQVVCTDTGCAAENSPTSLKAEFRQDKL